jgi:hypothetical protein
MRIYSSYAIKLLKMQNELLQTLDRHRRGHHQTVEVHQVHLHSGSEGVIGIVNPPQEGAGAKMTDDPMHPTDPALPGTAPRCGARTEEAEARVGSRTKLVSNSDGRPQSFTVGFGRSLKTKEPSHVTSFS